MYYLGIGGNLKRPLSIAFHVSCVMFYVMEILCGNRKLCSVARLSKCPMASVNFSWCFSVTFESFDIFDLEQRCYSISFVVRILILQFFKSQHLTKCGAGTFPSRLMAVLSTCLVLSLVIVAGKLSTWSSCQLRNLLSSYDSTYCLSLSIFI